MFACKQVLALLSIISVIAIAPATAEQGENVSGGTLCTETTQYALCTSAPCTIDPRDPEKAICDCDVASGPNWGKSSCADRMPVGSSLYSNFAPIQMGPPKNYRSLVCKNKIAWASCLGAPCTLSTDDAGKATCLCPLSDQAPWFTFGGDCDPAACKKIWSAAAVQDFASVYQAFARLNVAGSDAPQCTSP